MEYEKDKLHSVSEISKDSYIVATDNINDLEDKFKRKMPAKVHDKFEEQYENMNSSINNIQT